MRSDNNLWIKLNSFVLRWLEPNSDYPWERDDLPLWIAFCNSLMPTWQDGKRRWRLMDVQHDNRSGPLSVRWSWSISFLWWQFSLSHLLLSRSSSSRLFPHCCQLCICCSASLISCLVLPFKLDEQEMQLAMGGFGFLGWSPCLVRLPCLSSFCRQRMDWCRYPDPSSSDSMSRYASVRRSLFSSERPSPAAS